jgi:chromosomal replication initiator protein
MDQSPQAVWNHCLEIVRDNITRQSFKTWFEPLKAVKLDDDGSAVKLTIQLPSRFYYEWLEEHYFALLRKTITKVLGPKGRLYYHIVVDRDDPESGYQGAAVQLPSRPRSGEGAQAPAALHTQEVQAWPAESAPPSRLPQASPFTAQPVQEAAANPFILPGIRRPPIESNINPSYTFERFIEGDCNRLARSASLAIAQRSGNTSFNPFLVYGGVGLGKTHLIHAIGNYARAHNVENVLYISSERFTNDFVQSIQHNRVSEFSQYYRQVDLLIVDDVQFFGGKEKTQEEFFHIFNALHQTGKQIVLSADRPPRDIEGIEERLLSRFQWGLSADVQMPELETRIAILQRKAEDDGIDLPYDVVEFIAHNVKSNIRELEGALIRLLAHATLHRREIELALAKEVLKDLLKETRVNLSIEEIQRIACEYFKIPEDDVRAKTRKREVVQARQVAMYFCKHLTQHSLKTIGLHFGGRDHSTVIHANQSVENQIETDPKFREVMNEIRRTIELRSR